MWSRADLKTSAKIAFRRNYWTCVAVSLIGAFFCGEMGSNTSGANRAFQKNNPVVNGDLLGILTIAVIILMVIMGVVLLCLGIFVGNVVQIGCARYYMENREHQTRASQIFYGFRNGRYGNVVLTMFLKDLYVFLWSLLLIVPGIIKGYAYMMVPYILSENPEMDRRRAFELSERMMDGHKMDAFVLGLSFFGWILLGVFTCGILNIFYVSPYTDATFAEFYAAVKAEALQKGIAAEYELPGHYVEIL